MTLLHEPVPASSPEPAPPEHVRHVPQRTNMLGYITTTSHKSIGMMYTVTAFIFFVLAGVMAELMRAELARPGLQFLSNEQYNQLFTIHGTVMMFLFAPALALGFANYIIPLQIGAPDVSFPRLNGLAYWLYAFGGTMVVAGFLTPDGAADFGWFAYAPLNSAIYSPGTGADLWIFGLTLSGLGTILGAVNLVTTILTLRAPGMTMFRMPMFTWTMLVVGILILVAFPVFAAASLALAADRLLGAHVFDASTGGAVLWQHLFWFFGHPEVYIIALPFFGIISEVLPVFSRKPLFGYKGLVFATIGIGALSIAVWAHHMFATGAVLLPFFSLMSFLIAIPTGVKFFNWVGTYVARPDHLRDPDAVGRLLPGDVPVRWPHRRAARQPPDRLPMSPTRTSSSPTSTTWCSARRCSVATPASTSGFQMTGRMLDERLGKLHAWTQFIGFHMTFLVQHYLGIKGMPRRVADYSPSDGFTTLNTVSTAGAFLLGASQLVFFYNVIRSYRHGELAASDDPWGYGNSLEWATSCPPPRHNFVSLPRIRSERPAFDLHYPEVVGRADYHSSPEAEVVGAPR